MLSSSGRPCLGSVCLLAAATGKFLSVSLMHHGPTGARKVVAACISSIVSIVVSEMLFVCSCQVCHATGISTSANMPESVLQRVQMTGLPGSLALCSASPACKMS